ncbi:MAG: hypothetical protein ACREQY_10300, partial [Candidatus Binatia bacterium]
MSPRIEIRRPPRPALLVALLASSFLGCDPRKPLPPGPAASRKPALHVLMINGGATRAKNYQSHLLHLKELRSLLLEARVDPARISIFSGDGEDPADDLAVRENLPADDFWLLEGTRLDAPLRTPLTHVSSSIPVAVLEPATEASIRRWFEGAAARIRAGDTLLLYVTDHGRERGEPPQSEITLWGEDEALTVEELRELLELPPPGLRIVSLMSQCHAGRFANLVAETRPGSFCGFFSTTADRLAYGCYPENRGVENIGHSFELFRALAAAGRFPAAHEQVLVDDATPDVPIRTSDVFLADLLSGRSDEEVNRLLRSAWGEPEKWAAEIDLLVRVGEAFGIEVPRSLADAGREAKRLVELADEADAYAEAWRTALGDLRSATLAIFLHARSDWAERVEEERLRKLERDAARELRAQILADLAAFLRSDPVREARLRTLHERARASRELAYRLEVREAALLRMEWLVTRLAGRLFLETLDQGSADARAW